MPAPVCDYMCARSVVKDSQDEKSGAVLQKCVAALNEFVRVNYLLSPEKLSSSQDSHILNIDDIEASKFTHSSQCLHDIETLCLEFIERETDEDVDTTSSMLHMLLRASILHQSLLDEPSPTLFDRVHKLVLPKLLQCVPEHNVSKLAQICLEAGVAYSMFGHMNHSKQHLEMAREHSQLKLHLTGIMGNRTKFQNKKTAQLVLEPRRMNSSVQSPQPTESMSPNKVANIVTVEAGAPQNIPLEDDTLLTTPDLDRIGDEDNDDGDGDVEALVNELNAIEQGLVLAYVDIVDEENAQNELKRLEMLAYLQALTKQSCGFNVMSMALLKRSQIEVNEPRTRTRATLQMEEILKHRIGISGAEDIHRHHDNDMVMSRQLHFFCARPVPHWTLRELHAKLLEKIGITSPSPSLSPSPSPSLSPSLIFITIAFAFFNAGMPSSALDIYEELECWENIMKCYVRLGRRAKAETMLRERIESLSSEEPSPSPSPLPRLLCVLGDVTNDIQYYHQAWEVSNHRFAKAQRSLAEIYFAQKKVHHYHHHHHNNRSPNPPLSQ